MTLTIASHCRLIRDDILQTISDPRRFLDEGSVYAFICSVSMRCSKNVVVVDPYFMAALHTPALANIESAINCCFGTPSDYEVAVIIIHTNAPHFMIAIYEFRQDNVHLYDPLQNDTYFTSAIKNRIQQAVRDLNGHNNVKFVIERNFNKQTDGFNCGVHVCLLAESYLMENGVTVFQNLDMVAERARIMQHVLDLTSSDSCPYVARVRNNETDVVLNTDATEVVQTPYNLRSRVVNVSPGNTHPVSKQSRFCYRRHNTVGCAGISANHYPDYYDSGTFGDKKCPHCLALLLNSETFSKCCSNGKVALSPWTELPETIRELRDPKRKRPDSQDFCNNAKAYNSLMSFASLQVGQQIASGRGSTVCLLNGDFRHCVGDLIPPEGESPRFLSLYFLNVEDAVAARANTDFFKKHKFKENIVRQLHNTLLVSHPFARACFQMKDLYEAELAQNNGQEVPHVRLTLLDQREVPENLRDRQLHPRQVNRPAGDTMCALWVSSTREPPDREGIHITTHSTGLQKLDLWNQYTDTCTYSILFPSGETGYYYGIPLATRNTSRLQTNVNENENIEDDGEIADIVTGRQFVSCRQYYMYRLQLREAVHNLHHIYNLGTLTQTYIIDASFKVDQQVAAHIKRTQINRRVIGTEALLDHISRGLRPGEQLGKVLVAPSSYKGCRAFYRKKFYDTAAIFREKGQPHFFLTFTNDPGGPEIKRNKQNAESATDAPHVVTRIWMDKSRKLQADVEKKNIFGKCVAFMESLEFQKRGGPHSHKLITIANLERTPQSVDEYISAEIPKLPDPQDKSEWAEKQRRFRELVIKKQLHKCGDYCQINGVCSKHFPKPFSNYTVVHENRPCQYKRRSPSDGGEIHMEIANNDFIEYNNSHVVPYNPFILMKYGCHHNVEWVYGRQGAKYALKYPLKGPDYQYIRLESRQNSNIVDYNEFRMIFLANYRSVMEAFMRLYGYPVVRLSHSVQLLPIHLPNNEPVIFDEGDEMSAADRVRRNLFRNSKLVAYFQLCQRDEQARQILYINVPISYFFDIKTGNWQRRRKKFDVVSRIQPIPPRYRESFALRLLLQHVVGSRSFEELRYVQGRQYNNFVDAAKALGLLDDEDVWRSTLAEGARTLNPREMRSLFVQILVFGLCNNALELWNTFKRDFYNEKNIRNAAHREERIQKALYLINRALGYSGRSCIEFGLPAPLENFDSTDEDNDIRDFYFPRTRLDDEDDDVDGTHADNRFDKPDLYDSLNSDQKSIIDIVERAFTQQPTHQNLPLFFVTGSGGTGKTYLYNALIYRCINRRKYILPTASTGIAATLLYNGSTVHATFQVPIALEADSVSALSAESIQARRIAKADVIIVDEISMLHRFALDTVDRLLRSLATSESRKQLPFGGKIMVFGGDFKQLLPVPLGGSDGGLLAQITSCIQQSPVYDSFKILRLTVNMRVSLEERDFVNWLEDIGKGTNFLGETDRILIPDNMRVNSLDDLIDFVFDGKTALGNIGTLCDRLVLAPLNVQVDSINQKIIELLPGNTEIYLSADTPLEDFTFEPYAAIHDVENLNNTTPTGFPPHRLELKANSVVVLLRNVDIRNGLCNGTRLLVERLGKDLLYCKILTGNAARHGCSVVLSRFAFDFKDNEPNGTRLHFRRVQFPVRLAYCMTINKAQGQTVSKVGVALETDAFSAGQIYVALSRVRTGQDIKLFITTDVKPHPPRTIRNVVAYGIQF